ncbi:MAG: SCO family protein [Pseudomonadota bacterium]
MENLENGRVRIRLHATGIALLACALGLLAILPALPAAASRTIDLSFLDGRDAHLVVAYAGFPGCATSCPSALATMGRALGQEAPTDIDLVFINVERHANSALTQQYAQAFHPAIEGVTLTARSSREFMRELGLQTYDSTRAALAHSNHIYVFQNRDGTWRIADVIRRAQTTRSLRERIELSRTDLTLEL